MDVEIRLNQKQTVSVQVRQFMDILRMDTEELLGYLNRLAAENPVVELEEPYDGSDRGSVLKRKLEWLDSVGKDNKVQYSSDEEEAYSYEAFIPGYSAGDESLQSFLKSQLDLHGEDKELLHGVEYLINNLDGNGYLDADIENASAVLGMNSQNVLKALSLLQSMEPAGVGARNLQECLALQLERMGLKAELPYRIVECCLELLGKNQLAAMAKKLDTTLDEIRQASGVIKALNPKPGSSFSSQHQPGYLIPDVIVVRFHSHYEILLNDYFLPKIQMSRYYRSLLKDDCSSEVRNYINRKQKEAEWIIKCIEQRNATLLNVVKSIVDIQSKFFISGKGNLVPMTLRHIAKRLDIHESTVSRAVRGKYLQCSWGIFELEYFFSKGISAGSGVLVTPDSIKCHIREIINGENTRRPFSDRQIMEILELRGINIARRTIAKYREESGIPGAAERKSLL